MSFDTLFDYTSAKSYVNGKITFYENYNANITSELNIIANLSSEFQNLGNVRSSYLTKILDCNSMSINGYGNALTKISVVESFSENTKNNMVQFYSTYMSDLHLLYSSDSKPLKTHFMRQMFCNPVRMTSDVGNLIANGNLTSEECKCVAMMIDRDCGPEECSRFLLI